jgi:phenylalanyl-tRNA synthetase beta subunit
LAYSLTYQSLERTLTDQEVNGFHERVREALRSELGADMRER